MSRRREWLLKLGLLVLAGIIQSTTIASVEVATRTVSPMTLTAFRVGIASLAFVGLLLALRPPFRWCRRTVADIALLGVVNVAVPFAALAVALAFITTSLSAALFQTAPVFTVALASLLLPAERLNAIRALGVAVAVAGAVIVVLGGAGALATGPQALLGEAIIVGAALSVAVGTVYARRRARGLAILAVAAGQMFAALALIAPLALAVEGRPDLGAYPPAAWGALAVASLGTPVLGYCLYYYIVQRYSASLAAFTGITTPLLSAAIGVGLLREPFNLPMALGTLLLIAGLLVLSRAY